MYGASGEIAYHFPLGTILHSEWEAVPFYRYTYENLQTQGLRRNRPEHAYRSRTVAIPQRRHCHIPFAETRAQGHLSESDQSRPGRGTIGFRSRRRRLLLLTADASARRQTQQPLGHEPMTGWIRWTAPAAAMISLSAPAHAVQYLSVSEAQKLAFPSASFTEVQPGRVWKTSSGGIFVLDHVIGKHLYIDYAVSLDRRRPRPPRRHPAIPRVLWRRGQKPKLAGAIRRQDQQQPAESGQPISATFPAPRCPRMHVTEGVKRILAAYGHLR